MAFLGHLDDINQVAGVGMGNLVINLLGLAIMNGMASSLDTFVS